MFDHFRMFYLKATILFQEVITLNKIYYIPIYFRLVGGSETQCLSSFMKNFSQQMTSAHGSKLRQKNGF